MLRKLVARISRWLGACRPAPVVDVVHQAVRQAPVEASVRALGASVAQIQVRRDARLRARGCPLPADGRCALVDLDRALEASRRELAAGEATLMERRRLAAMAPRHEATRHESARRSGGVG